MNGCRVFKKDTDVYAAPMMPLVCGSYATVQVNGNDISVKMEYL